MYYKKEYDLIKSSVKLLPDELQDWSSKYLKNHWRRYIDDLNILKKNTDIQSKILEIGGLPFHFTTLVKLLDYNIVSFDLNPSRGEKFVNEFNLEVYKFDIENDDVNAMHNGEYDFIVLAEVFEHLRINPIESMQRIRNLLSDEGKLLITTPNLYSFYNLYKFNTGRGFDESPYQQYKKLITHGHMGHVRVYSKSEMFEFMNETGFKVVEHGYRYPANLKGKAKILKPIYDLISSFRPYQYLLVEKK